MTQNPVVAVIAAIVMIIAVVFVIRHIVGSDAPPENLSFWYDMTSKELYGAPGKLYPPMTAPSGGEGVKARVYTRSTCDKASDRYIGYLVRFTPEAIAAMKALKPPIDPGEANRIALEGQYVKTPDDEDWYLAGTPEAREIMGDPRFTGTPGKVDKPCRIYID